MNPYSILGVSPNASKKDIKLAYRRLAGKHHPDKGGDKRKFQEIQAAYDLIQSGKADFQRSSTSNDTANQRDQYKEQHDNEAYKKASNQDYSRNDYYEEVFDEKPDNAAKQDTHKNNHANENSNKTEALFNKLKGSMIDGLKILPKLILILTTVFLSPIYIFIWIMLNLTIVYIFYIHVILTDLHWIDAGNWWVFYSLAALAFCLSLYIFLKEGDIADEFFGGWFIAITLALVIALPSITGFLLFNFSQWLMVKFSHQLPWYYYWLSIIISWALFIFIAIKIDLVSRWETYSEYVEKLQETFFDF